MLTVDRSAHARRELNVWPLWIFARPTERQSTTEPGQGVKALLLGKSLSQTAGPMPESSRDLPEVEPHDPEPVAVAIETARALFRTGEQLDALRWLRRAAERAEESGDDVRALNLARSAADLSTELQSVPPPPPRAASVPPPPPPPPTPRRVDEAVALAPYDDFSDKTQVDAAIPVAREVFLSGVQITDMPLTADVSPRSVTMPSPSSNEPTIANAYFAPVSEHKVPAVRTAVRVAVTRDPESSGTWLVRPLPEGSEVPPGCEEALLVALDPKSRLLL